MFIFVIYLLCVQLLLFYTSLLRILIKLSLSSVLGLLWPLTTLLFHTLVRQRLNRLDYRYYIILRNPIILALLLMFTDFFSNFFYI